jgi:hypothetical protein
MKIPTKARSIVLRGEVGMATKILANRTRNGVRKKRIVRLATTAITMS